MRKYEEEEDGTEEHRHPRPMVLSKHFQTEQLTCGTKIMRRCILVSQLIHVYIVITKIKYQTVFLPMSNCSTLCLEGKFSIMQTNYPSVVQHEQILLLQNYKLLAIQRGKKKECNNNLLIVVFLRDDEKDDRP